jgi:antitoxin StbD
VSGFFLCFSSAGFDLCSVDAIFCDHIGVHAHNSEGKVSMEAEIKQKVLDELEELRIEAAARERLTGFDQAEAVSHDEMRARYTQKD